MRPELLPWLLLIPLDVLGRVASQSGAFDSRGPGSLPPTMLHGGGMGRDGPSVPLVLAG